MDNNRKLLKDAIADAKTVKTTALENAKMALEEAFQPHLKELLQAKLEEMDREEEMDENLETAGETCSCNEEDSLEEEELSLESLLNDLEEGEASEDSEISEEESEEDTSGETEEEPESDAADKIISGDFTDEDLTQFVTDVLSNMLKNGELPAVASGEEEVEADAEPEVSEMEDMDDEEISVDELLAEIDALSKEHLNEEDDDLEEGMFKDALSKVSSMFSGAMGKAEKAFLEKYKNDLDRLSQAEETGGEELSTIQKDLLGKLKASQGELQKIAGEDWKGAYKNLSDIITNISAYDDASSLQKLARGSAGSVATARANEALETELEETKEAFEAIKTELNETKLVSAKLLYVNKIFRGQKTLQESQKMKVLKAFDKAKTISEAKLVYNTLIENLSTTKKPITESRGSASKAIGEALKPKPIVESNSVFEKMKYLAFYDKKY